VDAYPSLDLKGHVDSIQQGSGTKFTAFPPENATGQFRQGGSARAGQDRHRQRPRSQPAIALGLSVVPTVSLK